MPNYLLVIEECFPGSEAYTAGDPTNYNDIIWKTASIAKATLDASSCAINGPSEQVTPAALINGNIPDGAHIQYNAGSPGGWEFVIPAGASNIFTTVEGDTGSVVPDSTSDTLRIVGGNKITTSAGGSPDAVTVAFDGLSFSELTDYQEVGSPALGDNYALRYNPTTQKWVPTPDTPPPPSGSFNVIQLFWGPITPISGTASIPKDTSLPLVTEGAEIWTDTITPTLATSSIRIAVNATFSSSNASIELVFAIFRNGTCIGTAVNTTANKSSGFAVSFEIYDVPTTTSEITYSCRVGRTGPNGTWYINEIDSNTGAFAGTLGQNSYSVEEIGVVI